MTAEFLRDLQKALLEPTVRSQIFAIISEACKGDEQHPCPEAEAARHGIAQVAVAAVRQERQRGGL